MLEARGITFGYKQRPVLREIDLHVRDGEFFSILGINGAGKSTLLKCMLGILRPQKGKVLVDGMDSAGLNRREMAKRVAYVAQQVKDTLRMTVFDAVLMGRRPHITWGVTERDLRVVEEVMESLKMDDLALRFTDELSGGEFQKVVIARALAQQPKVLLLDEPTSNLDLKSQLEVMRIVKDAVRERKIAAVMAIHDVNLALRFSDRFMLLHEGGVLACGDQEVIHPDNIEKTYGVKVSVCQVDGVRMIVPHRIECQ